MCNCNKVTWAQAVRDNPIPFILGIFFVCMAVSEIFTKGCS